MVRGMGLHEQVRISQAKGVVTFSQDVKALTPKDNITPSLLLFALLHAQSNLLSRVETSGHGTGRLATDVLLSHRITFPPKLLQSQLAITFDGLNDRIASARLQSRLLASLRDALLPKLISGELRVSDAQRIVGRCVTEQNEMRSKPKP
jgi:type I restriction enzyme, S subunit